MKTLTTLLALTLTVMFSYSSLAGDTYFCEHKETLFIGKGRDDFIISGLEHDNFKLQIQEKHVKLSLHGFRNAKFEIPVNSYSAGDYFEAKDSGSTLQYLDGHLIVSSRMVPFGLQVVMAKCDKF